MRGTAGAGEGKVHEMGQRGSSCWRLSLTTSTRSVSSRFLSAAVLGVERVE